MAQTSLKRSRPLSPHMQIYRWPWTMATSIVHRITGVGNTLGTVFLVWWLIAVASGPSAYADFQSVAGSYLGLFVLFGYTWSLLYHLINGVRHLGWDLGYGFDNDAAERSSLVIFALSGLVTIAVWIV